jgi:phosphotransferase system  glucose/maltose/N-acetylglucosamine-specific IIC component
MTWVGWRLQRTEALITLAILALLAALLVPTGITMANAYHHDGLAGCLAIKPPGPACGQSIGAFQLRFESLTHLANWFTLIPGLIGVLLAAPFILDLEHRTYRLAWTQSITRGRWLAGKLAVPIVCALLASGALILLMTWWRTPDAHLNGRLDTGIYDSEGTVVAGYMLFAFALAVALGALWRRSAASVTVAFVGYFAMRIFVDTWLRDRLVSPLKATYKGDKQPSFLNNAHVISDNASIGTHKIAGGGGVLGGHSQLAAPGLDRSTVFHVVYQPASRFWSLQLAETGLFIGLAVVLVAFAVWWMRERIA